MDANGCGKSRLTPADPDDEHPEHSAAWSPDGKQLAYVRGSSASSAIYKMNADGSDPTLVEKFPTASSADSKLDWLGTTKGKGGNVEQEVADQGANSGCTVEAGDDEQEIQAPPKAVTPEAYIKQVSELLRENDLRGSETGTVNLRRVRSARIVTFVTLVVTLGRR